MADQGAEGLFSPWLRGQRINAVLPFIKGRVLDVGAGSGALAQWVGADRYHGVEIDSASLHIARQACPRHLFTVEMPRETELFDTIVALAVIEHVKDPAVFLEVLSRHLETHVDACIVISTPHPSADLVHTVGSRMGLFSRHAHEEHEQLLNRNRLDILAVAMGLRLALYRRFQFGMNQLAVFQRA